jgi:NifU-like protein involved in Fe-S cluster formation
MRYSELTRRYFESAPHAGVLREDDSMPEATAADVCRSQVFRGAAGNRDRGTWVQFDIRVAAWRCFDARFLAFGCPHTIAAAAWVAEQASGSVLRAALPEPVAVLAQRFDVPAEKLGRLLIVEDAWRAAIRAAVDSSDRPP